MVELALIASCFLVIEDLNQAIMVVGWMLAAFLVFVAQGVKPERAAHLSRLMLAMTSLPECKGQRAALDVVMYKKYGIGIEILLDLCRMQ